MKTKAKILDVCCGSKMFWFNKNNPDVIFADIRKENHVLCDGRQLVISPDKVMDFTNIDFPDSRFKLVVFDPPHLKSSGDRSWMTKKYGKLSSDWRTVLKKGFSECFRVLEDDGVLIFKWSEKEIKVSTILQLVDYKPLFGHRTMQNNKTMWICFMKVREGELPHPLR